MGADIKKGEKNEGGWGGGKKYCRKRMTVWRDEIGPDEILAGCQR